MQAIRKRQHLTRTEQLEFLLATCHRLMLEPHDGEARRFAARLLTMADLAAEKSNSRLVAALIKEACARSDELAFRLDAGGSSSLHIGATAARLCQSVTALQAHMVDGRGPAASLPATPSHAMAGD